MKLLYTLRAAVLETDRAGPLPRGGQPGSFPCSIRSFSATSSTSTWRVFRDYSAEQFFRGVGMLLPRRRRSGLPRVSRTAKNFPGLLHQRGCTQKLGARMYSDGPRPTRSICPTRCSRTSAAARRSVSSKKVRTDSERLISAVINIVFHDACRVVFVMVYAFSVALAHSRRCIFSPSPCSRDVSRLRWR